MDGVLTVFTRLGNHQKQTALASAFLANSAFPSNLGQLFQVQDKVRVEELRTIVKVQLTDGKGQRLLELAHTLVDGVFAAIPHRTDFRPTAVNVSSLHSSWPASRCAFLVQSKISCTTLAAGLLPGT